MKAGSRAASGSAMPCPFAARFRSARPSRRPGPRVTRAATGPPGLPADRHLGRPASDHTATHGPRRTPAAPSDHTAAHGPGSPVALLRPHRRPRTRHPGRPPPTTPSPTDPAPRTTPSDHTATRRPGGVPAQHAIRRTASREPRTRLASRRTTQPCGLPARDPQRRASAARNPPHSGPRAAHPASATAHHTDLRASPRTRRHHGAPHSSAGFRPAASRPPYSGFPAAAPG